MNDKNSSNQKKNDFLEAKMYYYNTDALTERDQMLNSKESSSLKPAEQKQSVLELKTPRPKKTALVASKTKARRKAEKNPSQQKVLERLAGLEDMYKQLVDTLNISKISVEIESIQENNEKFEDQISQLEQERLTLLEQITSLEAQIIFSREIEAEKNELKTQVTNLTTEKRDLENSLNQLKKEMNNFSKTVSSLENKKSIVYLSKEREALEDRISVVMQEKRELYLHIQKITAENSELTKKIALLDDRVKVVSYLDKKSAMFEEDLKESEKKNILLSERISEVSVKNEQLIVENKALIANQQVFGTQLKDQGNWQEKNISLEREVKTLTDKNKQLNSENQELMKTIINKEKNTKIDMQKQRLLERVDELEQERLNLFKIIGDMEEEKKVPPELIEKNDLLLDENKELKNENANAKRQIVEFIKNAKNMQTEIIQLKEKRASRLELEQEKGRLQKRIKDLEEQCSKLGNTIKNLNIKMSENQHDNLGFEHLRKEITKLEQEKQCLIVQTKNNLEKIQQLSENVLTEKNSASTVEDKIVELNSENKKLLEKIKTIQLTQPVNYVLDLEKLADLKEFVLESIQTRRWKSTEFVNGAYDAVGLFYRTILQERPINPNK